MFQLLAISMTVFNIEYVSGSKIDYNNGVDVTGMLAESFPNDTHWSNEGSEEHPLETSAEGKKRILHAGRWGLKSRVSGAFHKIGDFMKKTKSVLETTKKIINTVRENAEDAKTLITIGSSLITEPERFMSFMASKNWAVKLFGLDLSEQLVKDTAEWFNLSWKAIKVLWPKGKKLLLMLLPNNIISVVDPVTKERMHFVHRSPSEEASGISYALYESLKVVYTGVTAAIRSLKGNCLSVRYPSHMIPLGRGGLDAIYTTGCILCGLDRLEPTSKVTVLENDQTSLIVETRWTMKDVVLKLTGVQVGHRNGAILSKNEVLDLKINQVNATGTVSFEPGTVLKFISINLRVDNLGVLTVGFPSSEKRNWMRIVEGMAGSFRPLATAKTNQIFKHISQQVGTMGSFS